MKKSIDHLPKENQTALKRIVPIVREMCDDVEMIILFGSYARGDFRDSTDLSSSRKSGAPSDYDILVVCRKKDTTDNHLLWKDITKQCNGLNPMQPFRIIVHDVKYLKERLSEIHYFFSDIVKEGCSLYNSEKYKLKVNKELAPEQQLKVAMEHFKNWFESSEQFYETFQFHLSKNWYKKAAFMLHQSAESAYKALLLVYTNYAPYDHYLDSADRQTREILPDIEEIFPRKEKKDEDLFRLFDYAYIGARYDSKFDISKENLEYLAYCVKRLMSLTEILCKQKIQKLSKM